MIDDTLERMAVGLDQADNRFQPIVQVKSKKFESIGWVLELSDGKSSIKSLVLHNKNRDQSFEELEIIKILRFLSKPGKSIYTIIIFQIEKIHGPVSLILSPGLKNLTVIIPIDELNDSINWKFLGKLINKSIKKINQGIEYFKCLFEDANKDLAKFYLYDDLMDLYFNELIIGNMYWVTAGNLKNQKLNADTNKKLFIIEATYETEIKTCESSDFSLKNSNNSNSSCSNTFNDLSIYKFGPNNMNVFNLSHVIRSYSIKERIKIKAVCKIDRIMMDSYSKLFYMACPKRGCNKKINYCEGKLFCTRCQEFKDMPAYRYVLNLTLSDNIDSINVTVFDMPAKELFGISADCFKFWSETRVSKIEEIIDSLIGRQIVAEILPNKKRGINEYILVGISSLESYLSTVSSNSSNSSN